MSSELHDNETALVQEIAEDLLATAGAYAGEILSISWIPYAP
jgi:hypothetical protein